MNLKLLPLSALLTTFACALSACSSSSTKDDASGGVGGASTATGGVTASGGATGTAQGGATSSGGSSNPGMGGVTSTGAGGSGKGGSGTGGNPATVPGCEGACERVLGAKCAGVTDTQAQCELGCSDVNPECKSELSAYMTCFAESGSVTCSAQGPMSSGCDAEIGPLVVCTACDPVANDGLCYGCTKKNCCADLKAYTGASDVDGFDACLTACANQTDPDACFTGCVTQFPTAGKAYESAVSCQEASCEEPCICEAQPDDSPCFACLKASCCSNVVKYLQAADVGVFDPCAAACEDQACVEACVTASPLAGAAFNELLDCRDTSCVDACASP